MYEQCVVTSVVLTGRGQGEGLRGDDETCLVFIVYIKNTGCDTSICFTDTISTCIFNPMIRIRYAIPTETDLRPPYNI